MKIQLLTQVKNILHSIDKKKRVFFLIAFFVIIIIIVIGILISKGGFEEKNDTIPLTDYFEEYKELHVTTEHHRMMYYTRRASVNPDEVIDIRYMDLDDAENVLEEYHEFGKDNSDILVIGFRNDPSNYIEFSSGGDRSRVDVEITSNNQVIEQKEVKEINNTLKALRLFWTLQTPIE